MKKKWLAVLCLLLVCCMLPLQALAVKQGQVVNIVASNSLKVRSGPGTSYKSIGTAYSTNIYPYLGKEGDWYKIRYTLGMVGYLEASKCALEEGLVQNELSNGPLVDAVIRITHTSTLNIRSGPAKTYDVIGIAYPDETYPYVGPDNGWYIIELPNGEYGYVAGNRTEIEVRGIMNDILGGDFALAPVITATPAPTPTPRPTYTPVPIVTAIPYTHLACGQCSSTGVCTTCDGAGVVYGAMQQSLIYCPSCLGTTQCWICNGTGVQYVR